MADFESIKFCRKNITSKSQLMIKFMTKMQLQH